MAYLKGIATKLTGSIGQFTFKQRGGLTVVSERVTNVANPRTAAQQNQRTKWGNVVRLYSGIAPLLNCAFENKPARTSCLSLEKVDSQSQKLCGDTIAIYAIVSIIVPQGIY